MWGLTFATQKTHWSPWAAIWWFGALRRKRARCGGILRKGHRLLFRALWLIDYTRPLRATLYLVNISIKMLIILPRSRGWGSASQRLVGWRQTAVKAWSANSIFVNLHVRIICLCRVIEFFRRLLCLHRNRSRSISCRAVRSSFF